MQKGYAETGTGLPVAKGAESGVADPALNAGIALIGARRTGLIFSLSAANPSAVYACDPVMGNAKSGCFVAPEIPVLLRDRVVPAADIITPNQFELGFLTGTEPADIESTLASVDLARAMGPSTVLVTSVERPDREQGTIEMLVADDAGFITGSTLSINGGQHMY